MQKQCSLSAGDLPDTVECIHHKVQLLSESACCFEMSYVLWKLPPRSGNCTTTALHVCHAADQLAVQSSKTEAWKEVDILVLQGFVPIQQAPSMFLCSSFSIAAGGSLGPEAPLLGAPSWFFPLLFSYCPLLYVPTNTALLHLRCCRRQPGDKAPMLRALSCAFAGLLLNASSISVFAGGSLVPEAPLLATAFLRPPRKLGCQPPALWPLLRYRQIPGPIAYWT